MTPAEPKPRIVIAVTEFTPVHVLWRAAMRLLEDSPAELVALFVEEDRWHRVASLPFTREISRTGGVKDFTRRRAEQIHRDAIARMRDAIQTLAKEASIKPSFEVLPESDVAKIRDFVGDRRNVLVAPAFISSRPVYAIFSELDCRILLVEAAEEQAQTEEG